MMANSASGESLIARVARILQSFDQNHLTLTAAEIARTADLAPATAHRLAVELARVGLLERGEDGRFVIGRNTWEVAARASPLEELRLRAHPVMDAVHSTLRERIFLTAPDFEHGNVLYLERMDRHGEGEFVARQAGRMQFHNISPGLVLLAYTTPELREPILERPLVDDHTGKVTDELWVRTMLGRIRTQGYIKISSELSPGNTAYAVPVFGPQNKILASMSVVTKTGAVADDVVISVLVAAGRTLSRDLGAGRQASRPLPWLR